MEPLEDRSLLQFWGPRYWFTWLVYAWMRTVVLLPFSWQLWLGRRLGRILHIVLYPRRHVAKQNLTVCFPELSDQERDSAQSLADPQQPHHDGENHQYRHVGR